MSVFTERFDSAKQEWTTPDKLYSDLNAEFGFEIDLAADAHNAKATRYFDKETNALVQTWHGVCWLNPPYGNKGIGKLKDWVKKAFDETRKLDCTVVMLIPVRTNTEWWKEYCARAKEIRFITGRPKFGNATHGLPLPLALIVFQSTDQVCKYSYYKCPK